MARTSGIEPLSLRGQRKALPIYQVRIFKMVGNRGIEPRTRKGAGFTGPLSHQTWRYPELVAGVRVERTFLGYEPSPGPAYRSDHPAKNCRGFKLLGGAGVHPAKRDR